MPFLAHGTDRTVERRIGRRVRTDGIACTWVVPRTGAWTLRRRPREAAGTMTDVSLTGANVTAPAELAVADGPVVLRIDGHETVVAVRQTTPTRDPEVVAHGVEFVRIHPTLSHRIEALVAERRPPR